MLDNLETQCKNESHCHYQEIFQDGINIFVKMIDKLHGFFQGTHISIEVTEFVLFICQFHHAHPLAQVL